MNLNSPFLDRHFRHVGTGRVGVGGGGKAHGAAVAGFVDDFLGTDDHRRLVVGFQKGFELGKRFCGWVPAIVAAVT